MIDDKVMRKIKRCLALAKSNNPTEAATALRQAQALMDQHGVSEAAIEMSGIDSRRANTKTGSTPPAHVVMLINMVARAFAVSPLYGSEYMIGRWVGYVTFLGPSPRPEIANYAFEVLLRKLTADRTMYIKSLNKRLKRTTKVKRGDTYARGWVEAVSRQITARHLSDDEQRALDLYKKHRYGELGSTKGRERKITARDTDAYVSGLSDGRKVRFYDGVAASQQPQRITNG